MNLARLLPLVLLAPLFTACATDRQVIAQADDTHRSLEPAVLEDPELKGYLQEMGQRITASAKALHEQHYGPKSHFEETSDWMFSDEMRFHFVNSETLNAFTTGGDHMYVYTQLLQQCRTEDELAAVMAHEYGHVYARHVHKGMNRQYMALGGAIAGGVLGYTLADEKHRQEMAMLGALGAGTLASFLNLGFTRDDEAEADRLGFDFYAHAGWDPARFGDFFQQMIDAGYDKTPEMLSDHPTLASRVQGARLRASKLPADAASWRRPSVADAARFAALKSRAAQLAKTMPDDSSLQAAKVLLAAVPSCLLPQDQPEQKEAQAKLHAALQQ
jgi:predicted Zn-dependent protease